MRMASSFWRWARAFFVKRYMDVYLARFVYYLLRLYPGKVWRSNRRRICLAIKHAKPCQPAVYPDYRLPPISAL